MPGTIRVQSTSANPLVVNFTRQDGTAAACYSDYGMTASVSLPATISVDTSFYFPAPDTIVISAKVGGVEIASSSGTTVTQFLPEGRVLVFAPSVDATERTAYESGTYALLPASKQSSGSLADVRAIPNLKWLFSPDTGFYSDAAGTTKQTVNGGTVKCWKDGSPNADHATDATGLTLAQGIGSGCDALGVAGAAPRLKTTGTFDSTFDAGMTVFTVVSDPTISANKVSCSDGTGRWYHAWNGSTNRFGHNATATTLPSPNVPPDIPTNTNTAANAGSVMVEALRYNGPSVKPDYPFHGYPVQMTAAASATALALTGVLNIGGLAGGGFQWGGNIIAVIVFNRALTDAEMQVVYNYLSGLSRSRPKPVVNCLGNSLTQGTNATRATALANSGLAASAIHGDTDWPSQLLDLYPADDVMVRTDAYAGRTLTQLITETPRTTQSMYDPASHAKRVAVVWEITNELMTNIASNMAQIDAGTLPDAYTKLVTLCTTLRTQGWLVGVVTCTPRADSTAANNALFKRGYQHINNLIRVNWQTFSNFLVDVAADPRLGLPGCEANTAYYSADKVHMTDAGYQVVAQTVKTSLDPLLPSGGAPRYLSKSVAGAANVTLKPVEAGTVTLPSGNGVVVLTGALTGNIQVVLPLTAGAQATFHNNTSGAFTVTLIGASGTGYVITQGKKARAYTDGTNWYQATAEV